MPHCLIPFFNIAGFFCYKLIIGLPVGTFSGINLTNTLENRAASGYEAPKALQNFSMETGFQVSGDIILLALLVLYILHLIYILTVWLFFQGNLDLFLCGDLTTMSGQCKFLSNTP